MGRVLLNDGILRDILEGRILGKNTRGRRRIQLIDDLLEMKNFADLKKAAEDRSVWGLGPPFRRADNVVLVLALTLTLV